MYCILHVSRKTEILNLENVCVAQNVLLQESLWVLIQTLCCLTIKESSNHTFCFMRLHSKKNGND